MADIDTELDEHTQSTLAALRADGQATDFPVQSDYFGFSQVHRVMLPDNVSWIEHTALNEGSRRDYLNKANREVRLQRVTGDAILKMASGDERFSLLKSAITNWNLMRFNPKLTVMEPVGFSPRNLEEFLNSADPKLIDKIEKDIREKNPWLTADATIEDIDQQIEELQKLREAKVKEQEGKAS
jgi:hypothetical protein